MRDLSQPSANSITEKTSRAIPAINRIGTVGAVGCVTKSRAAEFPSFAVGTTATTAGFLVSVTGEAVQVCEGAAVSVGAGVGVCDGIATAP